MATVNDMMRELVAYAHEEMRNRGIEEAAQIIESRLTIHGRMTYEAEVAVRAVRALKRDPSKQLSDWWGSKSSAILEAAIGAGS